MLSYLWKSLYQRVSYANFIYELGKVGRDINLHLYTFFIYLLALILTPILLFIASPTFTLDYFYAILMEKQREIIKFGVIFLMCFTIKAIWLNVDYLTRLNSYLVYVRDVLPAHAVIMFYAYRTIGALSHFGIISKEFYFLFIALNVITLQLYYLFLKNHMIPLDREQFRGLNYIIKYAHFGILAIYFLGVNSSQTMPSENLFLPFCLLVHLIIVYSPIAADTVLIFLEIFKKSKRTLVVAREGNSEIPEVVVNPGVGENLSAAGF